MDNKNMAAFPSQLEVGRMEDGGRPIFGVETTFGLTKREYFAAMALQGLLANPTTGTGGDALLNCSFDAVSAADALLLELSKPQP